MDNQLFAQPPTSVWSIMAPVKGRIIVAIALSALSSFSSLASLLTIPFITAELLSTTPAQEAIWQWVVAAIGMVIIAFTSRSFAFRVSHITAAISKLENCGLAVFGCYCFAFSNNLFFSFQISLGGYIRSNRLDVLLRASG